MKTYKVIAGGVTIDGVEQAVGTTLELESSGGQLRAWVHFKQVEEVKPKAAGKPLTKKEQDAAD